MCCCFLSRKHEHVFIMFMVGVNAYLLRVCLSTILVGNSGLSQELNWSVEENGFVLSGFFWGYAGLIDNIVNLIKKETGKSFKLVITGGFSDLFKNSIKTKVSQNQDITVKGLIKISRLIK